MSEAAWFENPVGEVIENDGRALSFYDERVGMS
jgi:hypothetical protein